MDDIDKSLLIQMLIDLGYKLKFDVTGEDKDRLIDKARKVLDQLEKQ